MSSKVHEPLHPPSKPQVPLPADPLSEDQIAMYNEVENHFKKSPYLIPSLPESEASLSDDEKFWLSHECFLRYLRATKWDVAQAIARLEDTLKWRREFGLTSVITPSHVEPEAVTGKEVLFGSDYWGRPAVYMMPSRQNTTEQTRQNQFAIWMLERAIDFMPPGVETIDLLINYADKAKNPALGQAREILNILQTHYPERLGLAIVMNLPWILQAFYKLITPFIDPHTRTKLKFNPTVAGNGPTQDDGPETFFMPDQLMSDSNWGGSVDFEYDHDKYWPMLLKISDERRTAWIGRWRDLGGTVGIKEIDYKTPAEAKP